MWTTLGYVLLVIWLSFFLGVFVASESFGPDQHRPA